MTSIRVAGYNVENLFSRPKVLNLHNNAHVAELLKDIAEFKSLIEMQSYAGHKARIIELYAKLKDYIGLNVRSRKEGLKRDFLTETELLAKGAGDFVGFVEFKRDQFKGDQIENTARVIKAVKPDILCFVEVEGREALRRFDTDILKNMFDDMIVVDGNDPRSIDVALAARKPLPIAAVRTNVLARDNKKSGYVFSRDCLEGDFIINGRRLSVLINHFKAKDRFPKDSNARRERQAAKVREILTTRFDLKKDLVLVAGDFNDEPDSAPLQPLVTTPGLHNVFDVVNRPATDRWTYYYGRDKAYNRIDMIFVSDALKPMVTSAGIERRGMPDLAKITKGAEQGFPQVTSWRNAGSDHAAVWVDLKIV